jgi:hypothetical protein
MFQRVLGAAALALCMVSGAASATTLVNLAHQAPEGVDIAFQLTDGRVLGQSFNEQHWYILTPDNKGSYQNGTWTQAASLPSNYAPYAFASAVLADGRVLVEGGEYNFGEFTLTAQGAVYDPKTNKWTDVKPPKGLKNIGDSSSVVMPDGRYVFAEKLNKKLYALDPATMSWTELAANGKNGFNSEEGLTLMPDGSLLIVDVLKSPKTERYLPDLGEWHNAGSTPASLRAPPCCSCIHYPPKNKCYYPPGETGPAILRPDGTVFATGGIPQGESHGHTAVFTGSQWVAGPDFPSGDDAGDNFAVLLPSGNVLVQGTSGTPYEFDGTNLVAQSVCTCGNSLMVLPTGEILVGGSQLYRANGTYQSAWQPTISTFPSDVTRGSSYQISGTQFNGLSQANAFGDELETATNYPLVRITNNSTGHVFYARTHDHSTMGVATGSAIVSTNFDVPSGMETGASSLVVVANGIPSNPVSLTVN